MKIMCPLIVILLCFPYLSATHVQSRTDGEHHTALQEKQQPPLRLAVDIVDQNYCPGDADLDGLRINVRLTYTNVSDRRLILYKGSNLVSRIMIGENLANIGAGQFKVDSSLTQLTTEGGKCFKGSVPSSCFAVLQPGTSYEVRATVGVFALRDDTREIAGAVKSGEHVLQLEVSTWPNSKLLAEELGRRWQRSGCLWYESVRGAPIQFTVEKQRKVVDCP